MAAGHYSEIEDQMADAVREAISGLEIELPAEAPEAVISDADTAEEGAVALAEPLVIVTTIGAAGNVLFSHSLRDRNYYCDPRRANPEISKFECIFVPGEWLRDRLLKDPRLSLLPESVIAVGHPRVDLLRKLQKERPAPERIDDKPRVLWAPGYILSRDPEKRPNASSNPAFLDHVQELEPHCHLVLVPHPRDRMPKEDGTPDRAPVLNELLDCDVVITDSSSIIFDAWSIGKPVIFPRWLLKNTVIKRSPDSAEAIIHTNRIGYHPESFEDLLEILAAGPELGQDVKDFMAAYLLNFEDDPTKPSSTAIIRSHIELRADPSIAARIKLEQEHKRILQIEREKRLAKIHAAAATVPKSVPPKPRASIQLLQQALLDENHKFMAEIAGGLRSMSLASLANDIAVLEVESALAQGQDRRASALAANLPAPMRSYFEAFECLEAGDSAAALDLLMSAVQSKLHHYPVWRLILICLSQLDEIPDALRLIKTLVARFGLRSEILNDLVDFIPGDEAIPLLKVLLKGKGLSVAMQRHFVLLATLHSEGLEDGLALARQISLKAAEVAPNWNVAPTTAGWGGQDGKPFWLLPFENMPVKSVYHRPQDLQTLCKAIAQTQLPFFLTGGSLKAAFEGSARKDLPDVIELGVLTTPQTDIKALALELGRAAGLIPCESTYLNDGRMRLRSRQGTSVLIQPHLAADQDGQVQVREFGRDFVLPFGGIEVWQFDNFEVPVPVQGLAYLDALGAATQAADGPQLMLKLHCDFIAECGRTNRERLADLAGQLKQMGDWGPYIHLAHMQNALSSPDLPPLIDSARFLIHLGDGVESEFHIDLWYSFVKAADPSAILAIRSNPLFARIKAQRPDLPAVYVKSGIEAEWLVNNAANLAGVLYVSNTGNTVHFLRFNHLRHVFLGHGDSEKVASCHKFFRAYDEVWTAGRAHIGRFKNSGMDHSSVQFRVVGRPTLRPMIEASRGQPDQSFLYLPTWEGFQAEQEYSSIAESESFLASIIERTGLGAMVKFHPWAGKRVTSHNIVEERLSSLDTAHPLKVLNRTLLAADIMPHARFLIADISSVVSDYLPTGRPIFLYIPKDKDIRTSTSAVPMEEYCYIFHDQDELEALIDRVIVQSDDWLKDQRHRAADYFVDSERTLGLAFEAELVDVARRQGKALADLPGGDGSNSPAKPQTRTLIVGHRGAKAEYVENSLSGFAAVAAMPDLDVVELDVHLTADGEIVVLHDPQLDRTTNGLGPVRAMTLAEIRQLKLRNLLVAGGALMDEGIPTLQEVLAVIAPSHLDLHIEIKNDALGNSYDGMAQKILTLVDQFGLRDRVTLTSFSPDVLADIRWMDKEIPLLASVNMRSVEMMGGLKRCLEIFDQIEGLAIALDHNLLNAMRKMQADVGDLGRFGVWVVNSEADALAFRDLGLRQITTDRPTKIIKALSKEH